MVTGKEFDKVSAFIDITLSFISNNINRLLLLSDMIIPMEAFNLLYYTVLLPERNGVSYFKLVRSMLLFEYNASVSLSILTVNTVSSRSTRDFSPGLSIVYYNRLMGPPDWTAK